MERKDFHFIIFRPIMKSSLMTMIRIKANKGETALVLKAMWEMRAWCSESSILIQLRKQHWKLGGWQKSKDPFSLHRDHALILIWKNFYSSLWANVKIVYTLYLSTEISTKARTRLLVKQFYLNPGVWEITLSWIL